MKLIIRMAVITLLTLGVIKTDRFFLTKPVFHIKNLIIEGASPKLEKNLEELKNILIGRDINNVDLEELRKKLLEDVRIEDVKIQKKSINEIVVNITEKKPKYYLQYKKKIYLLDREGDIYGYISDIPTKDFIFIVAESEEEIDILLSILDKMEATNFRDVVSQIYIKNKNLIEAVLVDGTIIKTNIQIEKEKYRIGSYLYFDLSGRKKLKYMDLRYRDYIVKYKENSSTEKEK